MKLSTKGRYGLRALVDLAMASTDAPNPLVTIANRQNISEIYLEQVFATLRKAGIVKSIKGAQGGYFLADHPKNLTVGAILRALEGDLSVIDAKALDEKDTTSVAYCVKVNVWDKIDEAVNEFVDSITLEDLVNEQKKLSGNEANMYFI